ncbi:hypothetical protein JOM49_002665 [Amycolatopsis magusensis]|uniref:Uncharacterized protein n=1 Tax=Amycolatopsis magusensis TaxID=882444 RepID=A0ABS4PNX5_9PSEU|nr:hypothetical protein [Amycolatopsis magusensis]
MGFSCLNVGSARMKVGFECANVALRLLSA